VLQCKVGGGGHKDDVSTPQMCTWTHAYAHVDAFMHTHVHTSHTQHIHNTLTHTHSIHARTHSLVPRLLPSFLSYATKCWGGAWERGYAHIQHKHSHTRTLYTCTHMHNTHTQHTHTHTCIHTYTHTHTHTHPHTPTHTHTHTLHKVLVPIIAVR